MPLGKNTPHQVGASRTGQASKTLKAKRKR
nr:MAG TPA: hypothetical protein [Caudoviricetes sp.]